jgi:Zn-dependent metalloprotease
MEDLFDVLTSIDVAAHELGYAVCEKTANLAYQKESGAMNEGFLIFGELV